MASQPVEIELGAFAQGEVPPDLEVAFKDSDGVEVNLTGFTPHIRIAEELNKGAANLGTGAITIPTPADGKAVYVWVRDDMANVGQYQAQAWVTDGTKYYASDLYNYTVYDGPGDPPA
jgi:hypothetical protein